MLHLAGTLSLFRRRWASAIGAGAVAISLAAIPSGTAEAATRVEKSFDGWVAVCVETDEAKRCTLSQARIAQRTRRPVFTWTISAGEDNALTSILTVPAGVSIPDGVRVVFGNSEPMQIAYSICGPRACVATMPFDAGTLERMRTNEKIGVNYVHANKRLVQAEIDLKGFTDAYNYFVEQIK